jgi:transglutaminase-like putative cysteine protease
MRDSLHHALRIATGLVVISGYLALASVRDYGPIFVVPGALLLLLSPLGEWLDGRYTAYRSFMRAITFVYFCFIPYTLLVLGVLDGVIALIVFIQAHTLLHEKEERNYYHLYLMSFFLVLAAAVNNPEPVVGLVLLLFLVSSIWSFICLRLVTDREEASESGAVGGVVARLGRTGRSPEKLVTGLGAGLVFAAIGLCIAATLMTASFFVLTPRIEAGFLGSNEQTVSQTGLPDTVDLRGGNYVQEDPTPIMRVEIPDEVNVDISNELYWRTTTLPHYAGEQWASDELENHMEPGIGPLFSRQNLFSQTRTPHILNRGRVEKNPLLRQIIYMDEAPDQGLPALDLVQRVELTGSRRFARLLWDDTLDFTVKFMSQRGRRVTYEVLSEISDPSPDALRAAPDNYEASIHPRDYALLTYHNLAPETLELVQTVVGDATNPYDKAVALTEYLNGPEFAYTLDLPPLPPRNAIDAFLLNVRQGHCERFATALALMLRSQGIPTRVVVGYRGGEWDSGDRSFTVRQNMAHLWVEVLFLDQGWVVFDPSPRALEETLGTLGQIQRLFSRSSLKAKMLWYQEVIGFDRTLQLEYLRNLTTGFVRSFTEDAAGERRNLGLSWRASPVLLVVVAFLWVGVMILLFRQRAPRRQQRLLTTDQARAVRLFRLLQQKLRLCGVEPRGKTAEELAQTIHRTGCLEGDVPVEVIEVYNTVRFGGRPLSAGEYRRLRREIKGLEEQVRVSRLQYTVGRLRSSFLGS